MHVPIKIHPAEKNQPLHIHKQNRMQCIQLTCCAIQLSSPIRHFELFELLTTCRRFEVLKICFKNIINDHLLIYTHKLLYEKNILHERD